MGGHEIPRDLLSFGVVEARNRGPCGLRRDLLDAMVDAEDVTVADDAKEEQQKDRRDKGEFDCAGRFSILREANEEAIQGRPPIVIYKY
jgi:hypothetical protein